MQVENKSECTGCGACNNICPKGAITMQGDEYGFYKPFINKEKCINCGLCEKVCPLGKYKSNNYKEPKAYAFINSDEVRAKSSSGGAFSAFADYILKHNGVIYGVIWDDNIKAIHYRAVTYNELEKMHSSKYVQSNTKYTFKQAKEDLESGILVLFTGTPCQISGLKSYLQKEYKNLITIDLICHGTPSPFVFEKYKEEFMKDKPDEKLLNVNFRSKYAGWSMQYATHCTTTTTTTRDYHLIADFWVNIMNYCFNDSCGNCQFNALPRCGDITMGDFWGVDDYDTTLNDDKGTSIILVNNVNGKNIFEQIKNAYKVIEVPISAVIKLNPNIYKSSVSKPKRKQFLYDVCIKNKQLLTCAKKYIAEPFYMRLYRILPKFAKDFIKYKILKREKC